MEESNSPEEDPFESMLKIMKIAVPICFGVITLLGLIGNTLVILVVLCNFNLRSPTTILIANLATADLLFLTFCVPFTASHYTLLSWPFGSVWCRVWQYLIYVFAGASIYSLVLMSLARFIAVVRPIISKSHCTKRNTCVAIFIMWFVIVLFCSPLLWTNDLVTVMINNRAHTFCAILASNVKKRAAVHISFFLFGYIIPLLFNFSLHMVIVLRLWLGVVPSEHMNTQRERSKRQVTRMVVAVVIIFAICWCPVRICLLMLSVDAYTMSIPSAVFLIVSNILAYLNSCVNPIIYAFLSENFRRAFRKAILCNLRPDRLYSSETGPPSLPSNTSELRLSRDP